MSAEIEAVFQELFYGSGSWLGMLLFMAIITALGARSKELAVLMLPVTVFLSIDYFSHPSLMWHGIIMLCTSVFLVFSSVTRQHK